MLIQGRLLSSALMKARGKQLFFQELINNIFARLSIHMPYHHLIFLPHTGRLKKLNFVHPQL